MDPRVIPVLLLRNDGLYKGIQYKKYKYIGDPINAVRVFSEKEVDELILFDIDASTKGRRPNLEFVKKVAEECYMPFAIGGGISDLETIQTLLKAGAEKVIINSAAAINPEFVKDASNEFGRTSIIVSVDYRKSILGKNIIYTQRGTRKSKHDLFDYVNLIERLGAGEIIINSIDRDGTGRGLDISLLKEVTEKLSIPVVGSGGIGNKAHICEAIQKSGVSAVAAGSFFVFKGSDRSVLISYDI